MKGSGEKGTGMPHSAAGGRGCAEERREGIGFVYTCKTHSSTLGQQDNKQDCKQQKQQDHPFSTEAGLEETKAICDQAGRGVSAYRLQFPVNIEIYSVQPTTSLPSPVANDPLPGRATSGRDRRRRTQIPRRSRGGLSRVPEGLAIPSFPGKLAEPCPGTMVLRENYRSRGLLPRPVPGQTRTKERVSQGS